MPAQNSRIQIKAWIWRALQVCFVGGFLLLWQFAVASAKQTLVPSPKSCIIALKEMAADGSLWTACATSLQRVLIGFVIAFVAAVIVGVSVGLLPFLRRTLTPIFEVLRPIPPIAWIPIGVSILGIGDASAYFIIFIGAFFPVFTNVVLGVSTVDPGYLEVAKVFGATTWRSFVHVIIPSALPSIFAGLRVGLGFAWMCVVAAEMFASRSGLGYDIQLNRQLFRLDRVVADMIVIGAIGLGVSRIMTYIEWLSLPWRRGIADREAITAISFRNPKATKAAVTVSREEAEPTTTQPQPTQVDGTHVEVESVTFGYSKGVSVLNDINIDINPGEVFCILGKSGCGKSTLLRLLAGLESSYEGKILINNIAPNTNRSDVTMAFQHALLFPWKTCAANIAFALNSWGISGTKAQQDCKSVLSLVGLEQKADTYPHQLSGGQLQRVAMARAIACHPGLVLLDEPLSALDSYTRETLQTEISQLIFRTGMTAILVTHDISEALFMADRIALMSPQGKITRIFDVPNPRPRPDAFRTDDCFNHLHGIIWAEMRSTDQIYSVT